MGVGQASAEQANLASRTHQVVELVRALDLCTITLSEGSLHAETTDDRIVLNTIQNIVLNIAVLSNDTLHALHGGVTDELRAWEKHAINLISEYKVSNDKMFTEKT